MVFSFVTYLEKRFTLQSSYEIKDDICWLVYSGKPHMEFSANLLSEVIPLLESQEFKGLVIDLGIVDMINSDGIGQLTQVYKKVRAHQREMSVIGNHYLINILNVVQIADALNLVETHEEAKELLKEKFKNK